jgi:hypothetical protein
VAFIATARINGFAAVVTARRGVSGVAGTSMRDGATGGSGQASREETVDT